MSDGFTVRPAEPRDVDQIVDMFISVVDEGRWLGSQPPVDREAQRARFLDHIENPGDSASIVAVAVAGDVIGAGPGDEVMGAVAGDRVIGHARVDMEPYKVAGLGMMVHAEWRGRGVGGALVDAAVESARALGAHKLALQVWPHNIVARRLYRRHGFVEEGILRRQYRRANGELWDAVIMGLVLDEASPGSSLPA